MNINRKRRILTAWFLFGVCFLGMLTQLWLWASHLTMWPSLFEVLNVVGWTLAAPLVFPGLALLVINRQPANRVGWLMLLTGLGSSIPLSAMLADMAPPPVVTPGFWLLMWVDNFFWLLFIFPIFLIPLYFPTGQLPTPRWSWVNRLALGLALFLIISGAFVAEVGPIDADWVVPNPIGFIPAGFYEGPFLILWGISLLMMLSGSLAALFVRFRRSGSVERQQIKWLLYAGAFFLVAYGLTYFLTSPDSSEGWGNLWLVLAILSIPVAIAIAILRYRLYEIDLIIRRTLQYTILTGLLSLVYFGGVTVLQAILTIFDSQSSPIVVVLTTLAIAALFNPLRRWVQAFIDRRFYRQKYDAERALAEFATEARSETNLEQLADHLIGTVQDTLLPERVSLWMLPSVHQHRR